MALHFRISKKQQHIYVVITQKISHNKKSEKENKQHAQNMSLQLIRNTFGEKLPIFYSVKIEIKR